MKKKQNRGLNILVGCAGQLYAIGRGGESEELLDVWLEKKNKIMA